MLLAGIMCMSLAGAPIPVNAETESKSAAGTEVKVSAKKVEANKDKTLNDHAYVTENDNFTLYMREDDLSIVIEDKKTGAYMESAPSYDDGMSNKTWSAAKRSAIVITMINKSTDTKQADLVNDKVVKKISYSDSGFEATVYFQKYEFGMTLQVTLLDDGLKVNIPDDSIKEDGTDYYIGTISVYPFLGTSYLGEKEGYMLIPDGNGALIYLDDKEGRFNSGYSTLIYGEDIGFTESTTAMLLWDEYEMLNDTNNVLAPIYGLAHTDDNLAYLAIIESGAERASIEARPNGISVDYNRIYAKFIERKLYKQPTSNNSTAGSLLYTEEDRTHADLTIRYIFLSGDTANYSGMANAYRDYLIDNGEITVQDDNSYRTRIDFLGTEREEWLIGTKSVVMTTTDDIKEIYEDLENEGVTDILSVYKGWQKGGLWKLPIYSYSADKKIGGTAALTKLIKYADDLGIKLYLYNDALTINPDTNTSTLAAAKKVNKKKIEISTHKTVYDTLMYLTPLKTEENLKKMLKSYTGKGVNNLCVDGISNTLFTYNYSGSFYSRTENASVYSDILKETDESTNLILTEPFEYLWKYTESFLDMPLYDSSFVYEDEFVPFLSIVLKGVMPVYSDYVNFEANKSEQFLKLVETGMFPSFYITATSSSELINTNSSDIYSSEYSVYRDTILEYTSELKEINEAVSGAFISEHEIFDSGVRRVTYTNGVKIYVNYSEKSETCDGITLESMSYKVVR